MICSPYDQVSCLNYSCALKHLSCFYFCFREKEIDENLARMNKDLASWKTRIDSRKRQAQKEIDKRTKILAEVRIW